MRYSMALALVTLLVGAPAVSAQMLGYHMGPMMGHGRMRSMHGFMAWMNGAEFRAVPSQPEPRLDATMSTLGGRIYVQHCEVCHGEKGDGHGHRAAGLAPSPRDFTKAVYEFRSTPSGSLPTDEDLWKVISNGLHGTAMVPWISLSENQRWALVAYVESFSPRFATETRSAPIVVPKPPPSNPDLVAKGMNLYQKECATCHGHEGRGDGPAVIKGASRQMRPRDFTSELFKRGSEMQDIYLTLRTGLDGTPMLSFAKAITPDETWAVAAYVRTLIVRPTRTAGPMMGGGMGSMMMMSDHTNLQERQGMIIDMPGMAGMR